MANTLVETIHFPLNPDDNSGERVAVDVEIHDNGDDTDNIYTSASVTLQSYGRSATISLWEVEPTVWRELADRVEAAVEAAKKDTDRHFRYGVK